MKYLLFIALTASIGWFVLPNHPALLILYALGFIWALSACLGQPKGSRAVTPNPTHRTPHRGS